MALTATAESDSKRSLIIGIVIAIHLGAYYVIESGLSQQIIELVAPPVETKIIEEEIQQEELPPPPPPPDIAPPPPFIPPPEVSVQIQTQTNAIQSVTRERPPAVVPPVMAPPQPPPPVATTKAGFDPKRPVRSNADYYPSASIRAEEEGVTTVDIYIAADGRVTDARVKTSSGFDRLDQATLRYVKTWRMLPATRAGVAEGSWVTIPVRWKLERR